MGELLQPVELEEARGSFDGVDRPEDARERLLVVGSDLEGDEFAVQLIQALEALDRELGESRRSRSWGCGCRRLRGGEKRGKG